MPSVPRWVLPLLYAVLASACANTFIVGDTPTKEPDYTHVLTARNGSWLEPFRSPLNGAFCSFTFNVFPQSDNYVLPASAELSLFRWNVSDDDIVNGRAESFALAFSTIDESRHTLSFSFCGPSSPSVADGETVSMVLKNTDYSNTIVLEYGPNTGEGYLYNENTVAQYGSGTAERVSASVVFSFSASDGQPQPCVETLSSLSPEAIATSALTTPSAVRTYTASTGTESSSWGWSQMTAAYTATTATISASMSEATSTLGSSTYESESSTSSFSETNSETEGITSTATVPFTSETETTSITTASFASEPETTSTATATLTSETLQSSAITTSLLSSSAGVSETSQAGLSATMTETAQATTTAVCVNGIYQCGPKDSNGYDTLIVCTNGQWQYQSTCNRPPYTCYIDSDDGNGYCTVVIQ
ncbi:hypothetical protein HDU84_004234 [Entophlyctis sp. JEL0112]|nr:hypothetical protein HDU84_004234 [Entophlyctis sp. JEL0112]